MRGGAGPPGAGQRLRLAQLPGLVALKRMAYIAVPTRVMAFDLAFPLSASRLDQADNPRAACPDLDLGQPGAASLVVIGQPLGYLVTIPCNGPHAYTAAKSAIYRPCSGSSTARFASALTQSVATPLPGQSEWLGEPA